MYIRFLENLISAQILKKFVAFYATRMLITVLLIFILSQINPLYIFSSIPEVLSVLKWLLTKEYVVAFCHMIVSIFMIISLLPNPKAKGLPLVDYSLFICKHIRR